MPHQATLEAYLRELHLPTFVQNYQPFAQDALRTNLAHERYLLALCEAEVTHRQTQRVQRAIQQAKFPLLKDLASFDFNAIPTLNKQRVLELAQGDYLSKAETVIVYEARPAGPR
jgi:DNA replication protein DnaC